MFLTENYVAFKQMYLIIALHLCFKSVCVCVCVCTRTWVKCGRGYIKGIGWMGWSLERAEEVQREHGVLGTAPPTPTKKKKK